MIPPFEAQRVEWNLRPSRNAFLQFFSSVEAATRFDIFGDLSNNRPAAIAII